MKGRIASYLVLIPKIDSEITKIRGRRDRTYLYFAIVATGF
jgi:hypothetical protein